ncbi:MAG: OmpA family protein [Cyclobacteriaceae bacterium]|nr:OmpA family protein [Cyclobacteriaceae bacterium]
MKALTISFWIIAFSALCTSVVAQSAPQEYYVTIGVFAVQDNAVRFTAKANRVGFSAHYAINPARKLYYVYILQTAEKRKAFAFLIKIKLDSEYKDAWVFNGHLGEDSMPVEQPIVEKPIVVEKPVVEQPVVKDSVVETPVVTKVDSSTIVKPVVKKVAKHKFFDFKFLNAENGNEVRGELHFSESEKATQYQAYKANEMIDLPAPRNASSTLFITTVAPGYKVLETTINYKDPLPSSSGTGPDGEIIIPLTLTRAKRGDYIEFNNVSFYRNSVVMQPQFKDEMDGLVDLMKENLAYKVKIHGHCNGTESRDIVTLGTSTKFFESDPGNVKKTGSAKELTDLRAESARRYLVSQGISVERISTKGEGGKEMVYPQTSVYANYNDRIEVEVIRH